MVDEYAEKETSVIVDGKQSSSETSVDFQRTTWRYIPEDSTLQRGNKFYDEDVERCIIQLLLTCLTNRHKPALFRSI
jgi:hypothetical protein